MVDSLVSQHALCWRVKFLGIIMVVMMIDDSSFLMNHVGAIKFNFLFMEDRVWGRRYLGLSVQLSVRLSVRLNVRPSVRPILDCPYLRYAVLLMI
jgi:hypothetical protein